jgi:hypothetical protein
MSNVTDNAKKASERTPTVPTGSDLDPAVVQPGSEADPSTEPEWGEHVKEYFNQDVTPGEALPKATDEAKE